MLPTQRTAEVLITRWSISIIAFAPPRHSALTTAWTSCWCTTIQFRLAPSGKVAGSRLESSSVTVTVSPVIAVNPARGARESACLARLDAVAPAPERLLSASTSPCNRFAVAACPATRWFAASTTWLRSR